MHPLLPSLMRLLHETLVTAYKASRESARRQPFVKQFAYVLQGTGNYSTLRSKGKATSAGLYLADLALRADQADDGEAAVALDASRRRPSFHDIHNGGHTLPVRYLLPHLHRHMHQHLDTFKLACTTHIFLCCLLCNASNS